MGFHEQDPFALLLEFAVIFNIGLDNQGRFIDRHAVIQMQERKLERVNDFAAEFMGKI